MSEALLNRYNVQFYKSKDSLGRYSNTASGGGLAYFLDSMRDPDNIIESLEKIDLYLNGGIDPLGDNAVKGEVYSAYLDKESADIYFDIDPNQNNVLQSLPLQDFRDVLQLWLEFVTN